MISNKLNVIKNEFKRGGYFIILLFFVLIPIFTSELVLEPTNIPRFVYASIVLLIYIVCVEKLVFPSKTLSFLLVSFYLINVFSSFNVLNIGDAIYETQRVFLIILFITVLLNIFRDKYKKENLLKSIIIVSFIIGGYAFYQLIMIGGFSVNELYQINTFFVHKNILSSYLFLSLAIPIYSYVSFSSNWRSVSILYILFATILIVILQNRTVYLALSITLLTFLLLKKEKIKIKNLFKIFSIISILFILLLETDVINVSKFNLNSTQSLASLSERLQVWKNTVKLFLDNPIFGIGSGNWQYNFSKYSISNIENISINNTTFQKPHNDFLWILSELGIVGFISFVALVVFIFRQSYIKVFKEKEEQMVIVFSFLVGLSVISFFSFPKERMVHLFLIAVLIALFISRINHSLIVSKIIIFKISISIILAFNIVFGIYRARGEYYSRLLITAQSNNDYEKVIDYGIKAKSIFYEADPTSTPISSYIGWGYNLKGDNDSLLYYSKEAYKLSPYDFEVLTNYGYALTRIGNFIKAKEILLTSYSINKNYKETIVNLVVVEYNSKNFEEALKWLTIIPNYKKDYSLYLDKIQHHLK